jgi:hypothetical protein
MPIIDAGDYSQPNTSYLISFIAKMNQDKDYFKNRNLYYFNVYLGDRYFHFEHGVGHMHVCNSALNEPMFAVFHKVERSQVIGSNVYYKSYLDDCITMVWTGETFADESVDMAFKFLDQVAKNIELATGCHLPIPLGELQHQTNIEVAEFRVRDGVVDRISLQHERGGIPILGPEVGERLAGIMGFVPEYNLSIASEPMSSISVAARWQQKALRSHSIGEYSECVISCAIWSEIFLVRVTAELNRLKGAEIVDIEGELSRGLPRFLNKHLGSRFLKGNWDHKIDTTPVGLWYRDCYSLRNKIAHTGHSSVCKAH